MRDSPGSVVTLLCSGIQLYSAERRIADCILKDVKWASVVTSAQLAHASQSSEATVTRLCHKLGFENYRKFQLALARDVMEQQEVEVLHSSSPDPLRQTLQSASKELSGERVPEILGPAPAPVLKVNNRYRYRLTLTGRNDRPTRELIAHLLRAAHRDRENRGVSVYADLDPYYS